VFLRLPDGPSSGVKPETRLTYLCRCIWHGPDAAGLVGTKLGKNVVDEASHALTLAMTYVAPRVLHLRQILAYVVNALQRKVLKLQVPRYKPAFGECVEKFLIHAGECRGSVVESMG
jgi:hypothetical protein